MSFRIKTLAEIGEQHDRICDYLEDRGRIESSCKVTELYDCMTGRILDMLGVDVFDDEALDWVCEEPLIVGSY
ncbi:MAG: hypothetical protein K2O88_06750 [Paramuribaculum sp.]|nr:hypothetical protein [Paramuribaculum sp.]